MAIASTGRSSACVSGRWDCMWGTWGVAALSLHPLISLHWPLSSFPRARLCLGLFKYPLLCLKAVKGRNPGAASGVAGLSGQQEQEHSWGWQSLCVSCSCSSFKAFGEKPCQGEKESLSCFLGKSEMNTWTHGFNSLLPLRILFGLTDNCKLCAWAFLSDMCLYLYVFFLLVECNMFIWQKMIQFGLCFAIKKSWKIVILVETNGLQNEIYLLYSFT